AHQALRDITLEIKKGEIVALVGHTGSGKSTLIQIMKGLLHPDAGQVTVEDGEVGMVFQYPEAQLFAETVYEDIAFGPRNQQKSPEQVDVAVKNALQFVGLDFDEFSQRNPLRLSGGQMRRVAIAGVIAMEPDYLILDEPSSGLDPLGRHNLFAKIMALYKEKSPAVILVTHSMEEAATYANRMIVMEEGAILFDGKPAQVFTEHREELLNLGLEEPEVYQLHYLLANRGMQLPMVQDEEQLFKEIKTAKGWR
ncbi:MAG: ATP-binding cassette domain-containing protein, partial [Acidaminococcaceae bacterium]|nr:ATP-binding cassette domain-containing protein [Acidaminococcaceae bacterium]